MVAAGDLFEDGALRVSSLKEMMRLFHSSANLSNQSKARGRSGSFDQGTAKVSKATVSCFNH